MYLEDNVPKILINTTGWIKRPDKPLVLSVCAGDGGSVRGPVFLCTEEAVPAEW